MEAVDGKAVYNSRPLAEWVPDVIERVFERTDALRVVVFGSVERGDDGPDSDIDLLVVLPRITRRHDAAVGVLRELRDLPVPVEVIVVDECCSNASRGSPVSCGSRFGKVARLSVPPDRGEVARRWLLRATAGLLLAGHTAEEGDVLARRERICTAKLSCTSQVGTLDSFLGDSASRWPRTSCVRSGRSAASSSRSALASGPRHPAPAEKRAHQSHSCRWSQGDREISPLLWVGTIA
jgi:predicted nucleotidyltransferase